MKKAFTIAELLVAVALMAVVLTGSGYIFKVALDAQRTANATTEIMRNLRGITDQIDSDFKGVCNDAPLAIWFQRDVGGAGEPNRFDEIMFFASGDFSSYQSAYGTNGKSILKGEAARIWYGQADTNDPQNKPVPVTLMTRPSMLRPAARVLARNQHILISFVNPSQSSTDPYPNWPLTAWPISTANFNFGQLVNGRPANEEYEYDKFSIAQWKRINPDSTNTIFQNNIVPNCLGDSPSPDSVRPNINPVLPKTYQNLVCKGVASFAVQWGYWYDSSSVTPGIRELRWWPESSHFNDATMLNGNAFGVFFNVLKVPVTAPPACFTSNGENWYMPSQILYDAGDPVNLARFGPFPTALKFTIKLDSKTLIKGKPLERTFTHIVYLK